jgi:protein disulfide-isomerase
VKTVIRVASLVLMLLALGGARAGAAEAGKVAWHTDVQKAWSATCQNGRPLLVFVTRDHCVYCTQMKDLTYAHPAVAGAINRSFVPLLLDAAAASPLLSQLRVSVYPSTFVISAQAVILDRIDGYVPPAILAGRLNLLRSAVGVAAAAKGP